MEKEYSFRTKFQNFLFDYPSMKDADHPSKRINYLFLGVIAFYCIYMISFESSWVFSGEMWAEMATNYFYNSNASSFSQKLFSVDAGYIPFPQRIIALIGHYAGLRSALIPYYYTWSAIFLTAIMTGTFCLQPFKKIIASDALRFLIAITILIITDFETRTFINFTYFSVFFVAIICALALVDRNSEVPVWAWICPIFLLSKPALLCVLPAMIMASFVSKKRFRHITIVSSLACIAQLFQMLINHNAGAYFNAHDPSTVDKIIASIRYFVGFSGAYLTGPYFSSRFGHPLRWGIVIGFASFTLLLKSKKPSKSLIFVGFNLLFFNCLLNCFAISDMWNLDMSRLNETPVYRHIMVGFFGSILMAGGLIDILSQLITKNIKINSEKTSIILFLSWLILSGWLLRGIQISKTPNSPILNNSQWQKMSHLIDSGKDACVPINPLGWTYDQGCRALNPITAWIDAVTFDKLLPAEDGKYTKALGPLPDGNRGNRLLSMAVLAKPNSKQDTSITSSADVILKNGTKIQMIVSSSIPPTGGLLIFLAAAPIEISDIHSVTLNFLRPISLARSINDPTQSNAFVIWMGN